MIARRAVVFDLDGTLIDSRRDLASAVNRLRGEVGLQPLAVERVEAMVGEGARVLVERALADWPGRAARLDEALARFLAHYEACCLDTTAPYPGIPELLAAWAPRLPLAVLTNKPERLSRKILAHLRLVDFFAAVLGGDSLPARKPDPAGLHHLARRFGVAPQALLLVGDSAVDGLTAKAADCPLLFVEWGYGRAAQLAAAPAATAESPARLGALLATLGGGDEEDPTQTREARD